MKPTQAQIAAVLAEFEDELTSQQRSLIADQICRLTAAAEVKPSITEQIARGGEMKALKLGSWEQKAENATIERCAHVAEELAAKRRELETSRGFGPSTATPEANQYWCEEIAAAIRALKDGS